MTGAGGGSLWRVVAGRVRGAEAWVATSRNAIGGRWACVMRRCSEWFRWFVMGSPFNTCDGVAGISFTERAKRNPLWLRDQPSLRFY